MPRGCRDGKIDDDDEVRALVPDALFGRDKISYHHVSRENVGPAWKEESVGDLWNCLTRSRELIGKSQTYALIHDTETQEHISLRVPQGPY